jgi:hypothetical protein
MRWLRFGAILLVGCASGGVYLSDDTLMLGEAVDVVTPAQLIVGSANADQLRQLLGSRFSAEQIAAGHVVVLRQGIYWNNTASGIRHPMLDAALVPDDMTVERGNVVEAAVGGASHPYMTIRRVRSASLDAGGCSFLRLPTSELREFMGGISLVGARGAATLYCKGIENEGWQRPRTFWHKPPGAVATPTPAPVGLAIEPGEDANTTVPAQAVPPDLAQLIIARNDALFGLGITLPVWVDGAKVADLRPGSCTSLLLPAGDHVVLAGTAAPTDLFGLSKLDLKVSVEAGDRVVATYVIDPSGALGGGMSMAATRAKAYRFTARPATRGDVCRNDNETQVAPLSSEAPAK